MMTGDANLQAPEVDGVLHKPFDLSSVGQALMQVQSSHGVAA
jgi:hypothetical protein